MRATETAALISVVILFNAIVETPLPFEILFGLIFLVTTDLNCPIIEPNVFGCNVPDLVGATGPVALR